MYDNILQFSKYIIVFSGTTKMIRVTGEVTESLGEKHKRARGCSPSLAARADPHQEP